MIINRQFIVFLSGGVISAFIDIITMQILIKYQVDKLISTSAGFCCGLLFNYIFHARMTFKARSSILIMFRFFLVVVINYLITIFLVYLAYSFFHQDPLIGKIISLPIVAVNGFFLSKHWVFKI
jgi:putative flippase GtrA